MWRGRRRWLALGLAAVLAHSGCASREAQPELAGPRCEYPEVRFDGSIPAGRLNGCRQRSPHAYTLFIRPENEPINPSPWYAFRVDADAARRLRLTLDYGETDHRYPPKIQVDGVWGPLPGAVKLTDSESRATFAVDVPAGGLTIAAQPILTPADERAWVANLAATSAFDAGVLGHSARGRQIPLLVSAGAGDGVVVVVGRQHPPELTGARALHDFVARLAAEDALARRFRERFGVLVVPMLNPDGVAAGHWRHDSAGIDLNRDWGPFRRPEPQLLRERLEALAGAGSRPVLLLDFHSTWRDVLYTQPDDAAGARADFAGDWHRRINARLGAWGIDRGPGHNPGRPTLKTWAHETYGIPAITVELADDAPAERIRQVAGAAAEELMHLLLGPPQS